MTAEKDPGAPLGLYRIRRPEGEPELIDGAVPARGAILDLGCGTGRVTNALVGLGREAVAVDFDPPSGSHGRRRGHPAVRPTVRHRPPRSRRRRTSA